MIPSFRYKFKFRLVNWDEIRKISENLDVDVVIGP